MNTSYDQAIGAFTGQTHRNMSRYLSVYLEKFDITIEQWGILLRLSEEDGINQKRLSEKSHKDQPTVARILDILEKKDLVKRQVSPDDRRAFLIYTTNKGKALTEEAAPYIEELFRSVILKGIPEENLEIYSQVLLQINENINNSI